MKLEKDTVWLNRELIAQLYGRDYKTIAKHINNALREELEGEPVVAKIATPKKYEKRVINKRFFQSNFFLNVSPAFLITDE